MYSLSTLLSSAVFPILSLQEEFLFYSYWLSSRNVLVKLESLPLGYLYNANVLIAMWIPQC